MSLYASLFSGVSGLGAYSSALGMISDNIANLNTVGYKETRASFSTLVTETRSSNSYSPGGVQALPQNLISRQGLLQSSSSPTDLSIDGDGFFIVTDKGEPVTQNTDISFTRAGSFTPDSNGFLKNTAGFFLMGMPIASDGTLPNLEKTSLQPINVANLTSTAEATTNVSVRANLQSSQTPNVNIATYNGANKANNMAGYLADVSNGVSPPQGLKPDFQTNLQVFDARGGVHTVTLAALKTATDNEWHVEMIVDPPGDITTLPAPLDGTGQIAQGTIAFNGDGTLDVANTTPALLSPITVNWGGGAQSENITFDLGTDGLADGLTQFAGSSTIISSNSNGATFGNVIGVAINKEGIVSAQFSNGLAKQVFKLPISTFQNPDGLTRRQGNSYTVSDQSGSMNLKFGGIGGAGTVAPQTLEASTVDLAREFTNLITIQRAFSASTKIITTADEMLNELNSVKR